MRILYPYFILFIRIFGYKIYKIANKEKINLIKANIKNDISFYYDENDCPYGLIIHKHIMPKYVCYIKSHHDDYIFDLLLISTESTKKTFLKNILKTSLKQVGNKNENENENKNENKWKESENEDENDDEKKTFDYYWRSGNYNNIYYSKRTMVLENQYNSQQYSLSRKIIEYYNKHNNVVSYIYGNIGLGKTFMAYLLCNEINGMLCDSFNPCEPGDYIQDIYSHVNPTCENPFVLILDEVDILLKNIHCNKIEKHKNIPTQIYNKNTWNNFLDKIELGLYPYMLVLLCSNKNKEYIDNMDHSYLRKGRVNVYCEFKNNKND